MTTINLTTGANADDGRWNNSAAGGQTSFYSNSESAIAVGSTGAGFDFVSLFARFPSAQFSGTPTITGAILTLNNDAVGSSGSLTLTVCAVDTDNPTAPTTSADARGRATTTATVSWTPSGSSGDVTVDIATVIQELVDSYDYVTSAKGFVIYLLSPGTAGQRRFAAHNGGSNIPKLDITYTAGAGTITGTGALSGGAGALAGSGTAIPPVITGTGALSGGAGVINGAGAGFLVGSGAIVGGAGSLSGRGFVGLPGLVAFYSSDNLSGADGDAIASWTDSSTTGSATQATANQKPLLRLGSNGINGLPALEFDGSNDRLVTPSLFGAGYDQAITVYVVMKRKTGSAAATILGSASNGITLTRQEFSLSPVVDPRGSAGTPYTDFPAIGFTTAVSDGISATQYRQAPAPDAALGQTVVLAYSYDGAHMYMEANGLYNTLPDISFAASTANLGLTGALTIGTKADGTGGGNWLISHVAVCNAGPSLAVMQAETLRLRQKYGVSLTRVYWAIGDSTTRGLTTSNQPFTGPPGYVLANLTAPAVVINQGVSGSLTTDWIGPSHTWLADRVTKYRAADRTDIATFCLGINDTPASSDATVMARLQAIGDALRTAGFRTGMCNIPQEPGISALINAGGWVGHADFRVNLMAHAAFDNLPSAAVDYADATYYSDGLHLTDLGSSIWGQEIATAINGLASSSSAHRRGRFALPGLAKLAF